jgi:hypothetical protein
MVVQNKTYWFLGTVMKRDGDYCHVRYDDALDRDLTKLSIQDIKHIAPASEYNEGDRVWACFGGMSVATVSDIRSKWYKATILNVKTDAFGNMKYDIEYDDGDFESDLYGEYIKPSNYQWSLMTGAAKKQRC